MQGRKEKVAIIGGGCGGLSAAFELSRPELRNKYEVTVYQMGWRLGGKGASSRAADGRIEEHGLHLWLGFYENAFRHMRECYATLNRDPKECPIATFDDAFFPDPTVSVTEQDDFGHWDVWSVQFPEGNGKPGETLNGANPFSLLSYLRRAIALLAEVLGSLDAGLKPSQNATQSEWIAKAETAIAIGQLTGLIGISNGLQIVQALLSRGVGLEHGNIGKVLDRIQTLVAQQIEMLALTDKRMKRLWTVVDLVISSTKGVFRFGLLSDPRGFDAVDDIDLCDWLTYNGAHPNTVKSPFLRASLYDLTFAFKDGETSKPAFSAAVGLRCAIRSFLTYRGSMFYKMGAGMGDIVFAPLYEVLVMRGVKFEFFHRLEDVQLAFDGAGQHVSGLTFNVQAQPKQHYQPLVRVKGLPVWPDQPLFDQLRNGRQLSEASINFESEDSAHSDGTRQLRVSIDFDYAVLALSLASIPRTCSAIVDALPSWRTMVEEVKTIGTQAAQLWLKPTSRELGYPHPRGNLSGFVTPFDTWADMSHLAELENWQEHIGSIAYFCSVIPDQSGDISPTDVKRNTEHFLRNDLHHLWPELPSWLGRPDFFVNGKTRSKIGLDSQYFRANTKGSERYVQSLPGTSKHRISPLDRSIDNLTVAGDWTDNGLNAGCVEAAVMSGMLASHAISGHPKLEHIVGYDHL